MSKLKDSLLNLETLLKASYPTVSIVYQQLLEKDENNSYPLIEISLLKKSLNSSIVGERTYINFRLIFTNKTTLAPTSLDALEEKQLAEINIKQILRQWQINCTLGMTDIYTTEFLNLDNGIIGLVGNGYLVICYEFKLMLDDN